MRKFRFVGDPDEYDIKNTFPDLWDSENIFDGDLRPKYWDFDIKTFAEKFPNDWQEITDEIQMKKPLHKDTDLGYFAGLAMQGFMANPNPDCIEMAPKEAADWSIKFAKELIKQLDNETDGH